jgi:uncharacterized MAPEG superfamily protein
MRLEYITLAACVVLGFVYLFAAVSAATRQRGVDWNSGNREGEKPLRGAAFRLDQAFRNFRETFPLFAAALLAAGAANRFSYLTVTGAQIYFWARLAYLPVYGFGIRYLRSMVWMISVAGIFCVLAGMLL